MDASQYKDYILTLLFMKYVSDKHAGDPDALIEVPDGGSFADMVKLKGDKEIGDGINKIISRLAEANELKGVIDQADFNDESKLGGGREMQDRLSRLVAIFENLDFRANRTGDDDLLGDAYEYLMRHFATESGKSKGQFYTPAEVSRIMAQVAGIGPDTRQDQTIYDPTCGSGSLLLKAADEAPRGITIYGQEMDLIPPVLVVDRCFAAERAAMEALQAVQETAARELEEFIEEHSAEEGLLGDALNDKGKVTKAGVTQRLKAIGNEPESEEESSVLAKCLTLLEAGTKADKAVKEAQAALDEQTLACYTELTETGIKTLVVEDKWFASIDSTIKGEVQRITQQFAERVRELEERYASPLPNLEREVEAYSEKVKGHLEKMGLSP